jgi:hypothetical protein
MPNKVSLKQRKNYINIKIHDIQVKKYNVIDKRKDQSNIQARQGHKLYMDLYNYLLLTYGNISFP